MTLKELFVGFGTQVRSIWMIGLHAFAKRETQMYPEEPVYLPPRFRGRIVLTRDPDGEERCVACNLCAVACPVGCIVRRGAMEFAFYICGLIAILATLRVITHTNPVHALLYLIISLLAISGVFFSLGAYFAGALEIIVYAGAIMVLFVFVVMMLNLGGSEIEQERQWLKPQVWIGPAILSAIMLVVIVYAILGVNDQGIDGTPISAKAVGISLFGPYVLAVELASMLLLAGLVVAFHVGREERSGEVLSNRTDDRAKRKTEEHA